MSCKLYLRCGLLLALPGVLTTDFVRADVVRLQTGAEIRGEIIEKPSAPAPLVIETLAGARIAVPADSIAFVTRRSRAHEEYEVRARSTADAVEAQWELALWCKSQRLTEQHERHAEQVISLQPDHEPAHRALGHVWKEDAWVDMDVYMTERGYVKHKGRWITRQEFDLLEKTTAELTREQEYFPKIRLWTGWVTGNHHDRAQKGLQAFQELADPDASPAIVRLMGKHPSRDVRLLAVQTLGQLPGPKSAAALSQFVVADPDQDVAQAALAGIPADQHTNVQAIFITKLKSNSNSEVNRAANALARVGDDQAVIPLINALITSHKYVVRAGSESSYSFGTNGTMGGGPGLPPNIEAGLRTGQYPNGVIVMNSPLMPSTANISTRIVTVKQDQQNPEVLVALQKLTGEDFRYDERTWHLWWTAQKHNGGLSKS